MVRNQQVVGSNPTGGSKKPSKPKTLKVHFGGHSLDLLRIVRKMSEFVKFHAKRLRRARALTRVRYWIVCMDVRSLQVDNDMDFPGVTRALAVAAFGRKPSGAKFLAR